MLFFINNNAEKLFRYNKPQLIGKPINMLFKNETLDKEPDQLITNIKFSAVVKIGKKHHNLAVTRVCVRDHYKNIQGFVYIIDDLTGIKSLKKAKDHAEISNKLKSDFIHSLYKEISKPLNVILKQTESRITANLPDYEKHLFIESISDNCNICTRYFFVCSVLFLTAGI